MPKAKLWRLGTDQIIFDEDTVSENLFDTKRNFRRLIVRTNASSLTPEREQFLREHINDPSYLDNSIEKLADTHSNAFSDGYLADHIAD